MANNPYAGRCVQRALGSKQEVSTKNGTNPSTAPPLYKPLSQLSTIWIGYLQKAYLNVDTRIIQLIADYADYAVMALIAYDKKFGSYRLPSYIEEIHRYPSDAIGFSATTFKNTRTKKITIAYRGTVVGLDIQATVANLVIQDFLSPFTGGLLGQGIFNEASQYAQQVQENIQVDGYSYDFTGHSLGGALAFYAGEIYGKDVFTFNSSFTSFAQNVVINLAGKISSNIIHFKSVHDPVTGSDSSFIFGTQIEVRNATDIGILAGHSMENLMNAMRTVQFVVHEVGGAENLVSWKGGC